LESEISEREFAELVSALSSAYAPKELDESVNEQLIRGALEDPFRPATDEEVRESERLRRALDGEVDHPDLELARSLAQAHRADPSEPEASDLVERAAHRALRAARPKQYGAVVYATFASVLAAAAAVAIFVQTPADPTVSQVAEPAPASAPLGPALELSRTSEELFKHKFTRGHTSERIDLIAAARARDLRKNRFRQWGVE
jgi:hypothetical protein